MFIDEMIKVLEGYKAGKKIEVRTNGTEIWTYTDNPSWNFAN